LTETVAGLLVALGIGLLIGLERERRKSDPSFGAAGGVRTHAVVALSGALAMQFAGLLLVAIGAAFIGALVVVAYWRDRRPDIGLTSEVTLFTTYLLGAYATVQPALAAAIGVIVALTLVLREALHRFVSRTLTQREVLDLMLLAAAVLVILPLLPDRAIDAAGVVNPRKVGQLTVLMLGINALGHVALRALGPDRGLPVAGFFGGFISSVATIGAMGAKARAAPGLLDIAAAAALCSSVATAAQVVLVVSVANPSLVKGWLLPAALMAAIPAAAAGWLWRRSAAARDGEGVEPMESRAVQPFHALAFSVTVTAMTVLAAWLALRFGDSGAQLGIGVGGFVDAHSATASAAVLAGQGALTDAQALQAILWALCANTLTKLVVAYATAGHAYLQRLLWPHLAMLAAAALVLLA
jgi:uncharacterized membrane protein (DUF4010 family)